MANKRAVPVKSTVGAVIGDAYSMLSELRDEVQEVVDNMPENLQQSSRAETLSEAANCLDNADSEPDVPEFVADLEVTYAQDQRKRYHSRADRRDEAVSMLSGAVSALEEFISTERHGDKAAEEENDEAQTLLDEVQEMIDNADGAEFPGMRG